MAVLQVNRRTPTRTELVDWLATIPGFLQGGCSVDGEPLKLYEYQLRIMGATSRFRAILKSRQTGFSFTVAAESLAKAMLRSEYSSVFVSYNLDDAVEKIRHAEMLYESLPTAWKKKRITDNKTSLEFEDGQGRRTRILSLPCREPRGKGKTDVCLDELPFMRYPKRIYTAAMPMISRGGGSMTLGSTPLGTQDIFYGVMTDREKYPLYERFLIPWWECPEFCTNVHQARIEAPGLSTDERVERFGTQALKDIRSSLDLDSFQQEFEITFQDDKTAYIPWELIQESTRDADELKVAETVDEFLSMAVNGPLYAGYDVGRRRNASELMVVERVGERYSVRLMHTLDRTKFAEQRDTLKRLLEQRPDVKRICIDSTGLGMQLAEEMVDRYPSRAEAVDFTNAVKGEIGGDLKVAMEGHNMLIPADRELMAQIHSVRKTVTVAGNIRLDADHDEKHHADRFWALALALHASGKTPKPNPVIRPHVTPKRSTWR